MKFHYALTALTVVLCSLLTTQAPAQTIIYSDSFDRTTGSGDPNGKPADPDNFSSWGDNDNALGGTTVNTWLVGPDRGGGANQTTDGEHGTLVEGGAHYVFDVTTVAPSGFTVEFDFNRFNDFNEPDPFGENPGFVSVGLGADTGAGIGGGQFTVNNSDVSILFQQSVGSNIGNTQIHEDAALKFPATAGDPGPLDYGDPLVDHSVKITAIPASVGQYGETDTVNISLEVDGGTPFDFSVLGGAEFGNLAFAANQFVHRNIDNLIVTALPSTGIPGDADGDNDVDGTDFLILQRDNPGEIATWQANYPAPLSAIQAVPEPSGLMLVTLSALLIAAKRRN